MIQIQQLPNNLFLFNPQHGSFLRGEVQTLPTAMTRQQALRYFGALLLTVALPASLLITVLIAMTGRDVTSLLLIELASAIFACGYVAFMSYRHDRALMRHGQIVIGEIIACDRRPIGGLPGHRIVTRMRYRFATPQNKPIVKTVNFDHHRQYLPDGRRYPDVGTKIAILYADRHHQLLL
jgi:hypothetical protein